MHFKHIALALAAGLTFSLQAQAVSLTGVQATGGSTVTDFTTDQAISLDLDLRALSPVTLNFTLSAADVAAGGLSFNALVRDMAGIGLPEFSVQLQGQGVSFTGQPGSFATDGFASVTLTGANSTQAWASFSPAVTTELYVGNPLLQAGQADWQIGLNGRQAGDTFSVTLQAAPVPEPSTYALLASGVVVAGLVARRRKPVTAA